MTARHILVVDDEPDIRILLKEILEDEGFDVAVAENAARAREARRQRRPDLVLLDIWMPDTDGITLLKEWSDGSHVDVPVVMMSGHGTVETAVEATRLGAYDFIEKPLSIAKLLITIQRGLESATLQRENIGLRRGVAPISDPIGRSRSMETLRANARRIAQHKTTVFIVGESGTGKEVIARYLHKHSPRANGPFIAVNVAGIARENPDAEIFGTEDEGRVTFGSLEQANGGTLFLKDIGDMDLNTQARLLSALEQQALLRVGGREPVSIDVRIVAATRRDLALEVAAGKFRDDLFYHLNVVPLQVPPLRDRLEDIDDLITHYLNYFVTQEGLPRREFTTGAKNRLRDYRWPGNVRELKNLVQRLLILGTSETIEPYEISSALDIRGASNGEALQPGFDLPLREAREKFEKAYLEYQLHACEGSVSKVADRVGIERTHLYRKLRNLGIDPKHIKESIKD
ncbi:MAG: sigma-54-dependent Fis family transcriptional regulator [Gammaproteobacteria bacterium]|nr:sigma-54-dependent Fis family transcriptional regulator [Gammaproteobacteria bacterium]MBI5617851.1 sigma-54-dependent Fis family transcriptional regulator [Gammaproteobacteria bacterium]